MNGDTPAPCPQLRTAGRCHCGSAGTPVPHQPRTSPAPVPRQSRTSPTPFPNQSPHHPLTGPTAVPHQSHSSPSPVPQQSITSPAPVPHWSHTSPEPVPSLPCGRDVPAGVSHTAVLLAVCGAASAGRLIDALGTGRLLFLSASIACQCSWEDGGLSLIHI